MSVLARCGSVAVLLGVLVGTAAFAQDKPEAAGSWTDPPARGAAGPSGNADGAKPSENKTPAPAAQAPDPIPAKPAQRAEANPRPATAYRQPARPRRTVAFRRYTVPIKRLAAKPRMIAAAPAARPVPASWGYRLRVAARQERELRRQMRKEAALTARRDEVASAARARHRLASVRRRDRDDADMRSYAEPVMAPAYARRAGWGELVDDDRAYRIAQARASGYRVMRLRTYAYPGGRYGELVPYGAGGFD